MSQRTFKFSVLAFLLIGALVVMYISTPANARPSLGITNFDSVHLRDTGPTAQPVLKVDQLGAGKIVEFLDGGTPVFSINNGGGIVASSILTQGAVITNLVVSAPTAVGTATPAAVINNDGVSNLLEIRDSSTPVFTVGQGGVWSSTGAGTHSGGQSVSPNLVVSAPTAIATATPGLYVNNAGAHNSLVIAKNATPNFTVGNTGAVTGLVLRYATAGQQLVTGTTLVTGTATASHGLTTVTFCIASMGEDPTAGAGDGAMVTTSVSANVCTLKVWQDDFVTAASEVDVDVHWLVVGTP